MLRLFLVAAGLLGVVSCAVNAALDRELTPHEGYSQEKSLVLCVVQILKRYYAPAGLLTFVEMSSEDEGLLQAVHSLALLSVVYRKPTAKCHVYNRAYLLTADSVTDFTQNFEDLTRETTWNPHVKFIVVVKRIEEVELREVFDVLLRYHVLNVLVVNGTDPFLYTYNPYEDYACGKYYNRIINFGRCPTSVDLYPNKLTTRLRRCTVTVAVVHLPPYAIHPTKVKRGMLPEGVEQYVMKVTAKIEQFNITYIYKDFHEEYSTFTDDMTVLGPLSIIQNNEADIMIGGRVMSSTRAAGFDYTSAHLHLAEDIKIVVKRASLTPVWKYFYLEFEPTVWLLLLLSLVAFAVLMILLLQIRDRCYVFVVLLDNLVMHGRNIRCRWAVKCIFICWIWFAYLVNCFYQSNLSSFTTKPGREPQISNIDDLISSKIKPCVSSLLSKLLLTERNVTFPRNNDADCETVFGSIKAVSKAYDKYSVILYSIYFYQKHQFYDEYGTNPLYVFDSTISKLSYGIFMYKGFPLKHSLYELMIRLRENGLIQQHREVQNYIMNLVNRYKDKKLEVRFIAPWHLFGFGLVVSSAAFLAEILYKLKAARRN